MDFAFQLSSLRNKLANHRMSVLVGSGFSKNVSQKFPTWDELVHDLVYELHKEEVDAAYWNYARMHHRQRLRRSQYIHQKVQQIIQRLGYLHVVSDYLERKGYAEAIATYIEERTPYLERQDGKIFLTTGGHREEISSNALLLHKALLQLPWNNVYTTNYDDLLESSVDANLFRTLRREKQELEEAVVRIKDQILNFQTVEAPEEEHVTGIINPDEGLSALERLGGAQEAEGHTPTRSTEENVLPLKTEIEEKEKQIKNVEAALSQCFTVVKNASELQLKRNKNIVKLHGSLRDREEREQQQFGFDGNPRQQYVIAKEHYDTYTEKHEAFTQLMRIALLQESFCLIGFSGVDPNFLAWIGWVRDLLYKHVSAAEAEDYKIYLIDVGTAATSEDKQLFFENHSIVCIPLRSPEVLAFLKGTTSVDWEVDHSISGALRLLFSYLSDHEDIVPVIPSIDLIYRKMLRNTWQALHLHDPNKGIDTHLLASTIKRLVDVTEKIVIPDLHYAHTHNQHTLLHFASVYLSALKEDQLQDQSHMLRLLVQAVKSYGLPIRSVFPDPVIERLLQHPDTKEEVQKLLIQNASLNPLLPFDTAQASAYDQILYWAFGFQFKELKAALDTWQPEKNLVHLKAGFTALFHPEASIRFLQDQLGTEEGLLEEQRLYSSELLSFIDQSTRLRSNKKLDRLIRSYEAAGYEPITTYFEYLNGQFGGKAAKPKPFGKGRFTISHSVTFAGNKKEEALQYLMLLVRSGFQLQLKYTQFQPLPIWYKVFRHGFESHPLPFIFYSLQYGDDDFLKRIGQDTAFSDALAEDLPAICNLVLSGYHDAPAAIRQHLLCFTAQLFVAVDPEEWQAEFYHIWKGLVASKEAFSDRLFEVQEFIQLGLRYIACKELLFAIVVDLLQQLHQHSTSCILYLYTLNGNQYFGHLSEEHLPAGLQSSLQELISELSSHMEINLFALGNVNNLLGVDQRLQIQRKLSNVQFETLGNERLWHVLVYFAQDNEVLLSRLKSALLQHPSLWYTGIKGSSIQRGGRSFVSLEKLTKYTSQDRGVVWSSSELGIIFEKLKGAVADIARILRKNSSYVSFLFELEEMVLFLRWHQEALETRGDFGLVKQEVEALYDQEKGYGELEEGLASKDPSTAVWALSELSRTMLKGTPNEGAIMLVLSRILLQEQIALEESLKYVASWMGDERHKVVFQRQVSTLVQILKRFKDHPAENVDIAFVHDKLIRIARVLASWGVDNDSIRQWKELGAKSRFNNIKQANGFEVPPPV